MNEHEYRRRIQRNRIVQEEKKLIRQQLRQIMIVCALACVILLVCCLWSAEPTYAKTNSGDTSESCVALMRWPLNGTQVVGKYDAPKQQWLPGHRGVDLLADQQEAVVAPADGVIAFRGRGGGKSRGCFTARSLRGRRGGQSRGHHTAWRQPFWTDLDVRTSQDGT